MYDAGSTVVSHRTADVVYTGPERRARAAAGGGATAWSPAVLDELDYGIVLLDAGCQVLHLNHAAEVDLDAHHPLQLLGRQLRARAGADVAPLHEALAAAVTRRLRRLLELGRGEQRVTLAVAPVGGPGGAGPAAMVTLGKRQLCERLSVQWFAQSHGLTRAETRVLDAVCRGLSPTEVARAYDIGVATVRTQLTSIRAKTGAADIRSLVQRVALLPPMVSALR